MKKQGPLAGAWVILGLFIGMVMGCSDSGGSAPVNVSNRINLLFAENGTLAPVDQTGRGTGIPAANHKPQYTLTLENLTDRVLWYTERPARQSGSQTVQSYMAFWSRIYGEISPNAVLDGYVKGQTTNDGLFLMLEDPVYDSATDRLTFLATLLDTTIDPFQPDTPITLDQIKITVLDNSPQDQTDDWSFAQVAPDAFFEPTQTQGVYKLSLDMVYPESYYMGNAPNRRAYLYTVTCMVRNWLEIFENDPPNASMTSYTAQGDLRVHMLTIDDPVYNTATDTVTYTATLLHGSIQNDQVLYSPTLFIDKVSASGTHAIQVHNKCTETIWLGACGNCKTAQSPCPEYFDPPKGANVEIDKGGHVVFHVQQGWAGRFWPRTGCDFNKDGLCESGDCCDSGGCVNQKNQFAKNCYYSGNPPVLVIEPTFDAPSGNGPIDYFDASMVDGFHVLMSINAVSGTYNPSPDPGMDPKYWCTTGGCNSSPTCPDFLLDGKGNCWSPCQHAIQNNLPLSEQEKLCCSCDMKDPCTCPAPCCDGHYGCSPYVLNPDGTQKYPPNMCCDPWGKLNNNRPWDQKYIDYITAVKAACPEVYAWQFDDFKSTINCRKTHGLVDYKLTLCP